MKYSIFKQSLPYNYRKLFVEGYQHVTVDNEKWSLSLRDRAFVGSVSRALNAPKYLARTALKSAASAGRKPIAEMNDGYALCDGADIPGMREAFAVCEEKLAVYLEYGRSGGDLPAGVNPEKYHEEMAKTATDPLKHVPYRYDRDAAEALIRPFLSPQMYLTAANYLGLLPVLASVRIVYSPNEASDGLRSSQMFHVDPEGSRQVKVFVAARSVGPQNSPLTFIPEHHTCRLIESGGTFTARRVKDFKLAKHVPEAEWVAHVGDPGRTVFVDTSRCFHYGSRPSPEPRLLLYAQYLDPFCSMFDAHGRIRKKLGIKYGFHQPKTIFERFLLSRD